MNHTIIRWLLGLSLVFGIMSSTNIFGFDAENVDYIGHIGGPTDTVFMQNNYAYIGEGCSLRVLDMSNPIQPLMLGNVIFPNYTVYDIFVLGNYAYVACGNDGLQIVDISNPNSPYIVGTYDTPGNAYDVDVYVNNTYAFVADWSGGLRIIDVSNPASPTEVGHYGGASNPTVYGVFIRGNYAYTAEVGGFSILDISSLNTPVAVSHYSLPGKARQVYVNGNYAYVANDTAGLRIFDISNLSAPVLVGSYNTPGIADSVLVIGTRAYVADGSSGLRIIDVSTASIPFELGHIDTPGYASEVFINSIYAFVADNSRNLRIIDISNPVSPVEVYAYEPPSYAQKIAISGNYLYVADEDKGLVILDVSEPSTPNVIGYCELHDYIQDIFVQDNLVYLTGYTTGLHIINVSSPSSPVEIGSYDTLGYARGVFVSGNLAYVADDTQGLRIIDISNSSAPVEIGSYATTGCHFFDVYVRDDYAYVVDGNYRHKLLILNISNSTAPEQVGYCDTQADPIAVYLNGNYAYVACRSPVWLQSYSGGLGIFNIYDPADPYMVDFYPISSGNPHDVYVSGNKVYLAADGLKVLEVSNPLAPYEVAYYQIPASMYYISSDETYSISVGGMYGISVDGTYAYIANSIYGVFILHPKFTVANIPDVKLLIGTSQSEVLHLNNYLNIDTTSNWTWTSKTTFANLNITPNSRVDYLDPLSPTAGLDTVVFRTADLCSDKSVLKYSSYLLDRFPDILVDNGQTIANGTLDINSSITKKDEVSYPSFYIATTKYTYAGDSGKLNLAWSGSSLIIQPTAVLSRPAQIIITVKPDTTNIDWDKALLWVYELANSYGQFTASSDTNQWYFEQYSDGNGSGILSWSSAYHMNAVTQSPGQKAKFSQVFSVPASGWYTAEARVGTDITEIGNQQKVYLYLQEFNQDTELVAAANHVIYSGNGGFGDATTGKKLQISFYTQNTVLGVQLVSINSSGSGIWGSLYFDDIWIYPAAPLVERCCGATKVSLSNPSFERGTSDWFLEPYSNSQSAGVWTTAWSVLALTQYGGDRGKASHIFQLSKVNKNASASAWVYSDATSQSEIQKIYLSLYSYDSSYSKIIESGNAVLYPGKWSPGQWQQLQFGYTPVSNYNAIQLVGINPFNNSWATLYFDEMEINQDQDSVYYWNQMLY